MIWGSVSDFLTMGGYALYVWGSYGVMVVVLTAELLAVRRRKHSAILALRRFSEAKRHVP